MALKIPTSTIARPSKIYPNWDFWFENISSGITGVSLLPSMTGSTAIQSSIFIFFS
jgi:hypothetical protein